MTPKYEIILYGNKIRVGKHIWATFPGQRLISGNEFHGPVENEYGLIDTGHKRACQCRTCQSYIRPELRSN